jgi:hypothetical protein
MLHANLLAHVATLVAMSILLATRRSPPAKITLPDDLEAQAGTSQCNYEMLHAFDGWIEEQSAGLRYTIGAGTLLGAMRTYPPGLLQWEHDVDVYMPARDAFESIQRLQEQCGPARASKWCDVLHFRGLVDIQGTPCCGFGFKLFHRGSTRCELDVLVLSESDAPYIHGETRLWPPWAPLVAVPWAFIASLLSVDRYFVIPEDIDQKLLMTNADRWCKGKGKESSTVPDRISPGGTEGGRSEEGEWSWCGGPAVSYFQDEYFRADELFPTKKMRFYDFHVNIPDKPWALLNRTYGPDCANIARLTEHDGATVDLRLPEYQRLRKPAGVKLSTKQPDRGTDQAIPVSSDGIRHVQGRVL